MRRVFLTMALTVFVSVSLPLTAIIREAGAAPSRKSSLGDYILVEDDAGQPRPINRLNASVDKVNRTVSVTAQDSDSAPLWLCIRKGWAETIAPDPAFENHTFVVRSRNGTQWFGVRISDPTVVNVIKVAHFRPEVGRARYTFGSQRSISLERPMFVALSEVPKVRWEQRQVETRNGTTWQRVPADVTPLGINLTDADTSGQTVSLSRDWLGAFGLDRPYFRYADGTPIENSSGESHFHLYPRHFSILYVFTTSESFTKEDDGASSRVFWDSSSRNLYTLSDRRDPIGVDERMRSPSPVVYDQTTSFTVRAMWKTIQQGNWQKAVPLFFMGASNPQVHSPNSIYVLYTSRDANLGQQPRYYLRYVDSAGILRFDYPADVPANVPLEFYVVYDAVLASISMGILDADAHALGTATYYLGPNEGLALGKVGAGAWGGSDTQEDATIACVDNILLDANTLRNGGFEIDSDLDGIPDHWQTWPESVGSGTRSSTRHRWGSYSFRISESSPMTAYGLQSERIAAAPSESYEASVWVFVESGQSPHFDLYLEFFDAAERGTRVGVAFKCSTTVGEWEFLDLTMMAPAGTASMDIALYSSSVNMGTAYFDEADLRPSRSYWATEVHTNNLPTPSHWIPALDYVADLGMTAVRIDFVWASIEPQQGAFNWDHLAYWDAVVQMARARGIGIVAILAGPEHWPGWAKDLLSNDDYETLFPRWRAFTASIALRYGADVRYYQLLNEENHPTHGGDLAHTHEEEVRAVYDAYQGLLDGRGLTPAAHESGFKTIVNLWADDGGGDWNTFFRDILNDPWGDASIDIVAVDHYPGTWCCGSNYRDWGAFDTLSQIARDYGKEMAIMETGFSSWTWPNGQQDQERFVNEAMGELWTKGTGNNRNYPLSSFLLTSWYELIDTCSDCAFEIEKHFRNPDLERAMGDETGV